MIYAAIDTNVLVAALLTKKEDSATVRVLNAMIDGEFIPLYHNDILAEYNDVLHRDKFPFHETDIQKIIKNIKKFGQEIFPKPTGEILIDQDDLIFYEVVMEKRDDNAYLVTGNQKHYPIRDFIVTPTEMMKILQKEKNENSFLES